MKMRKSAGQAYGYTLYRSRISANTDTLHVINLRDYGMVILHLKLSLNLLMNRSSNN